MGTEGRNFNHFVPKSIIFTPGPGAYQDVSKTISTSGFKFGTDGRLKTVKSDAPGPGSYLIPCSLANVPRYSNVKLEKKFKYV